MSGMNGNPGMRLVELLDAWKSILTGSAPMLSIEITRECPLACPGCYAYGDNHLAGTTLRDLHDYRGDELVERILQLVRHHRPLHVSLVGGEPLVRHRELSQLLPKLGAMKINTLVVTSAVIPIPREWMDIPRLRVAVSVDGLPEHHDIRRKPATYEKILKNIAGCQVNIHWTITRPMLERPKYIEEYVAFWSSRPEVARLWVSLYTPQKDEQSPEMLTSADRELVARDLLSVRQRYPKLLMHDGLAGAMVKPPSSPSECMFARMSTNYSADLQTRVEPCIFGGTPDCSQCGCAVSSGLHWLKEIRLGRVIKVETIADGSVGIGSLLGRMRKGYSRHPRWRAHPPNLVQIRSGADQA
jgi:organic radical activating enzyme